MRICGRTAMSNRRLTRRKRRRRKSKRWRRTRSSLTIQ